MKHPSYVLSRGRLCNLVEIEESFLTVITMIITQKCFVLRWLYYFQCMKFYLAVYKKCIFFLTRVPDNFSIQVVIKGILTGQFCKGTWFDSPWSFSANILTRDRLSILLLLTIALQHTLKALMKFSFFQIKNTLSSHSLEHRNREYKHWLMHLLPGIVFGQHEPQSLQIVVSNYLHHGY